MHLLFSGLLVPRVQAILTKLIETKLMQLLRFKFGEVYTVSASAFFGAEAPSRQGAPRLTPLPQPCCSSCCFLPLLICIALALTKKLGVPLHEAHRLQALNLLSSELCS